MSKRRPTFVTSEEIHQILLERLAAEGISRAELARRAGVSAMAVTYALNDGASRYDETRAKLLRALGVKVSEDRFWAITSHTTR